MTGAPARLTGDWFAGDLTANQAIFRSLREMRNKVRQLARENDLCRRFITLMKAKVIGSKPIKFQAMVRMVKDDKMVLDRPANAILEAAMEDFSRRGIFDVTGQLSRQAMELLVVGSVIVDGEFLGRKIRGARNAYGFALQALDPALLDENLNRVAAPGVNEIVLGIERDSFGRPVNYYFREEKEQAAWGMPMGVVSKHQVVPAADIVHVYIVERPGQVRGVTWLCSSGLRMKLLDGYEHAVVVGKRVAAAKIGILQRGGAEDYEGDGEDSEGRRQMTADPGEFEVLPEGWQFKEWNPPDMGESMAEFERSIKQGIASGLSISYPSLSSDLTGVSYSSIRQGELLDRDLYALFQTLVIDQFEEAWYEDFLQMAFTSGAIALPLEKLRKFAARAWQPRQWDWVAPEKMMQAQRMKREMGVSATTLLAEMGYDIEEEAERIEAEPKTMLTSSALFTIGDNPDNYGGTPAPAAPAK